MSFTGQLGTSLSKLGSILLGSIGSTPLTVSVASSLNSWQDSTARLLGRHLNVSDTLVFSDTSRVILGLHKFTNSDLDNWLDNIDFRLDGFFGIAISDDLNDWLDRIELFKDNTATLQLVYKPNEVNYIRRYLNDVVTEVTDAFTSSSVVIYKANEITYIRRYLNDV